MGGGGGVSVSGLLVLLVSYIFSMILRVLKQTLFQAEKTAVEKEQMALMVEAQKEKTQEALDQIHHDDITLQDLRRQLKVFICA